jgi:V/A-type H+-transporting ATPase subunit E
VSKLSETAKFTNDILSVAKIKAQQIITDAENERQRLLEEAKASIAKEAADIIRNAQAEAEGIKRRQVSEVRHRIKLREQLEKDKILTEVLRETKERVLAITKDESKYTSYLASLVAEAIRQLGIESTMIHMNADDLKRIDSKKLQQEISKLVGMPTKAEFSKEPIAVSGGVTVSDPDGKIRIVNTFEQRFEALEPKLLVEAGKLLFTDGKGP